MLRGTPPGAPWQLLTKNVSCGADEPMSVPNFPPHVVIDKVCFGSFFNTFGHVKKPKLHLQPRQHNKQTPEEQISRDPI